MLVRSVINLAYCTGRDLWKGVAVQILAHPCLLLLASAGEEKFNRTVVPLAVLGILIVRGVGIPTYFIR